MPAAASAPTMAATTRIPARRLRFMRAHSTGPCRASEGTFRLRFRKRPVSYILGTMIDSFGALSSLSVGGESYQIHRLGALSQRGWPVERLPYSLKILLENLLRGSDGPSVRPEDVEAVANWNPKAEPDREIAFTPARVLLQ